jgi:hypothetical protein
LYVDYTSRSSSPAFSPSFSQTDTKIRLIQTRLKNCQHEKGGNFLLFIAYARHAGPSLYIFRFTTYVTGCPPPVELGNTYLIFSRNLAGELNLKCNKGPRLVPEALLRVGERGYLSLSPLIERERERERKREREREEDFSLPAKNTLMSSQMQSL